MSTFGYFSTILGEMVVFAMRRIWSSSNRKQNIGAFVNYIGWYLNALVRDNKEEQSFILCQFMNLAKINSTGQFHGSKTHLYMQLQVLYKDSPTRVDKSSQWLKRLFSWCEGCFDRKLFIIFIAVNNSSVFSLLDNFLHCVPPLH